ncbi:DeoR/GlpR family DNA-binding transcription regulator [Paenibacillus faecalis]|uniref:DeoR/GlpR family DNA-binding transcription regulator n=1 Tax=Paenibacillus faecalis TaxID=2079532 RepID=UPI00131A57BE|nr:DeoR/GlpR family DNA-binding transcription regulator [Paenibacillus faecalis]
MIVDVRRTKIKQLLLQQGSVKVSELVKEFNVSEETIRRDLAQLEREGLIRKNYGGAVLADPYMNDALLPSYDQRKEQFSEEKEAIGRAAADLVKEDQIVILDSGSTMRAVAKHLREKENLTIVTNNLSLIDEMMQHESHAVVLLGGKLFRRSRCTVGPQSVQELKKYSGNYVFLGAAGVSVPKGLWSADLYDAEVKQAMMESAEKKVLVADHSKFSKTALIAYSELNEIDILITSDLVPEETLEEIRSYGVEVIACKLGEH